MKNELSFTGEVVEIFPTQIITSTDGTKTWEKKEVRVVEFDEQYPQSITLEVFGADKIQTVFSNFAVGDRVAFWYNVRSNAFDKKNGGGRGSSSANGIWKCVKQAAGQSYGQAAPPPFAAAPDAAAATPPDAPFAGASNGDDLPF